MITVLNITEEGRGGGALFRIRHIAFALQKEVKTIVVCPNNSDVFVAHLQSQNIDYESIELHHLSKSIRQIVIYTITFIPEILHLIRLIKKHQPNVVYGNGSWQIKAIIAAYFAKTPSIWHMNDSYQRMPVRLLFRIISPLATRFVFASQVTKEFYEQVNPQIKKKDNVLIPAPVDTMQFHPNAKFVSKLKNYADAIKIVSVGYINANKGFEYLIEAIALLSEKITQRIELFIIGPVLDSQLHYKEKLDELIRRHDLNSVHFLNYQNPISDFLLSCDLYVCSSVLESSPMAVWEALACGKTVISTNVGDVTSLFKKYNCGYVAQSKNPEALASEIAKALSIENSIDLTKNALTMVEEVFSLKRVSAAHLAVYSDLAPE